MDIATLAGIASGFGLVVYTILSAGDADIFMHVPSAMVVFGGAFAATLVNFPLSEMLGVLVW
ncbi:hypothetical protein JYT44_02945 [Caldithrix abyssi]|nr:hypothetical protein [Caldithrix abyssi]